MFFTDLLFFIMFVIVGSTIFLIVLGLSTLTGKPDHQWIPPEEGTRDLQDPTNRYKERETNQ